MTGTDGRDQVQALWALFGKLPGDKDDYRVLACSAGQPGRADFDRPARAAVCVTTHSSLRGTAGELPQVSFLNWEYLGQLYFCVTVIESGAHSDRGGRPITLGRFFAIPMSWMLRVRPSLSALYDAVRELPLRPDDPPGPVLVEVTPGGVAGFAKLMAGDSPVANWLIRLTDAVLARPTVVTKAPVELGQRLAVIDTVMALLPAWARYSVPAATWTDQSRHPFGLAFANQASANHGSLPWLADNDPGQPVGRYGSMLRKLCLGVGPGLVHDDLLALNRAPERTDETSLADLVAADLKAVARLAALADGAEAVAQVPALADRMPVDRWPDRLARRIEGLLLDAARSNLSPARRALAIMWSPTLAESAVRTATETLRFRPDDEATDDEVIIPAGIITLAAHDAGSADMVIGPLIRAAAQASTHDGRPRPGGTAVDPDLVVELIVWAASREPGLLTNIGADLRQFDHLARLTVVAVAHGAPGQVRELLAAMADPPGQPPRAAAAGPAWLRLLAPVGDESVSYLIEDLDLDSILVVWAAVHALLRPGLVELTGPRLIALLHQIPRPEIPTAPGNSRLPALGWGLADRFGAFLDPRERASADVARLVAGLAPTDAPGPGEQRPKVDEYLSEYLRIIRSDAFAEEESLRLFEQLYDHLAVDPGPGNPAANRLLDLLTDNPRTLELEFVLSMIEENPGKRPGVLAWFQQSPKALNRRLAAAGGGTPEVRAARALRFEIRGLTAQQAQTPEALDALAEGCASEAFGYPGQLASIQTPLRELGVWPGIGSPDLIDDLFRRWEEALRRRGVGDEAATHQIRDARGQVLLGMWGTEPAHRLTEHYEKSIDLRNAEREREVADCEVELRHLSTLINEHRADIAALETRRATVQSRIEGTRNKIAAASRFKQDMVKIVDANRSR